MEPGETVKDAAVRKALEETGLYIKIIRLIGLYFKNASSLASRCSYSNIKIFYSITHFYKKEPGMTN